MTAHRLANLLLAILIAGVLSASLLLDGPSLAESDADTAADLLAAQAQARAARMACPDLTHCLPSHVRARSAPSMQVSAINKGAAK